MKKVIIDIVILEFWADGVTMEVQCSRASKSPMHRLTARDRERIEVAKTVNSRIANEGLVFPDAENAIKWLRDNYSTYFLN